MLTQYPYLVLSDGAVLAQGRASSEEARLDQILKALTADCADVDEAEAHDVLATAEPAEHRASALNELYGDYGYDIYLDDPVEVAPERLYGVFTDYGEGTTAAEFYPDRQQRLTELRARADTFRDIGDDRVFDSADEQTCRTALEASLSSTQGRVHLTVVTLDAQNGSYYTPV